MKNIFLTTVVFAICALSFAACKKVDCPALVASINNAAVEYGKNASNNNCLNYKKAIEAWLDESDCSIDNSIQQNDYRNMLVTLKTVCP